MKIFVEGIEELKKDTIDSILFYAKEDMEGDFLNALDYYTTISHIKEENEIQSLEEYVQLLDCFEGYAVYNSGTYIRLER